VINLLDIAPPHIDFRLKAEATVFTLVASGFSRKIQAPVSRESRTANRELRTANCELRTANCEK
jgi:hypothetical protein